MNHSIELQFWKHHPKTTCWNPQSHFLSTWQFPVRFAITNARELQRAVLFEHGCNHKQTSIEMDDEMAGMPVDGEEDDCPFHISHDEQWRKRCGHVRHRNCLGVVMLMSPGGTHSRFCAFTISTKFNSLGCFIFAQIEKAFMQTYSSRTLPPTMDDSSGSRKNVATYVCSIDASCHCD